MKAVDHRREGAGYDSYVSQDQVPNKSTNHPDDARQSILDAAIAAIDAGGEASLRIVDVAKRAGVTQGMVSYYFGDRDGLVAEAHLARYRSTLNQDTIILTTALGEAADADRFYATLGLITRELVKTSRSERRLARVLVLGAARGRPGLLEAVREVQTDLMDRLEHIVTSAQARGYIRADLSSRAIAEFFGAYTLGFVVADMDPARPSDEALALVVDSFTNSLRPD